MKVTDISSECGGGEWQAGDAAVWMRRDYGLYCWSCSSRTCEHVHAVWNHLRSAVFSRTKAIGNDMRPHVKKEEGNAKAS